MNNAYAIYDNQLSAWIPKIKNIYEDDYQFLYEYPINYSNINRRLRKIICNNDVCHAITENGLVFSWGNDSYHRGTLGLGDNIYQVNTPVLNKYLSNVRIFDISLSEEHCAAIDFNNNLYTWGYGEHGELGYYNENQIKVCEPLKVNICKNSFLVNKIKCGKYFTAGITHKGIPFLFGNKVSKRENINDDSIIFFSFNYKFKLIAKDIYCGEDYLIILLEKERLLIYSFNDGLFEIKLNNNNNNINYFISKVSIVDKNFYVLDERNKHLFEFIHYPKNISKPFNIYDFYQNEYEVNPEIRLSIIEMPFFVKFLFFWIECSENQKKEFNSQTSKMFHKLNEINFHYNCNKGPNINEYILFGNNRQKIELEKVQFENLYSKKDSNIFFKGECIISRSNKNNNFNTININININNIDSSFSSLNIPISKNYGNRNDIKDNNKSKLDLDIPVQSINNRTDQNINNIENRKTKKHNYKYGNGLNRIKYSISHDKKRTKINNSEYIDEEKEDNYSFGNLKINNKKIINTKNIITIDNNETTNNMLVIQNNKKENNSFLIKNDTNLNTNDDKQIEEKNDKNNYNHIPIRNSKNRSCSQIKEDKKLIHHNTSSITININNSKKEENEFDNILKDIDNRRLMLNQPIRIEKNIINTKKVLSHIGKTKSKTEMLIKELQETFFGKENNSKYSNYYSNYKKMNNKDEQKEEEIDNDDNKAVNEKEIIKKENEERMKERIKKEEMKLRIEREERERERLRIELEMKEKERIEKERKEKEKERIEKEKKEKEKEELEKIKKLKKEREEREKKEKEERERIEREREIKEKEKREMEEKIRKEKEKREKERRDKEEQERKERERREKERKEKEDQERRERERIQKEKKEREEKERKEKEEEERRDRERRERERKEKEEQERRERERIQKEIKEREEKERKEREEKERKEREKKEREEREERERINKMRLEKEKLEKEIIEIRERKEKERLIKEKFEKEQKEKEELIKKQKILEEEEKKRKEELLEKDLRIKLENEYKQKYEKEKKRNEEEQRKEKEKLERIEKEKNEKLLKEKNKTLEKIKELEKKEKILMELEKEKKIKEEQRKNLLITSEINNFIEGKNKNVNKDKNNNYKFLPEKLRTENESEFLMKGIDKKNYNYTISGNQQINIENHQANKNINKNNLIDNININNNNELNFHIEDIVSTRDIIFDNNNTSDKIDSLGEENKNFLNDLPLKLNQNKSENNHLKKVNNEKNFELKIAKNNIINNNNKDENENALKFSIEDNNKINLYKSKDKEKEDSLELTNISNKENIKEKENNNISDEDNDNEAPETVLELEEKQKKLNFNWKEKRKNRIREIIEEKQEFEMIQSIEDTLQNKDNKADFNLQLPLPYNNDSEQPIITPVSEISTNNMRHISTYDQNIISSIRKFEPKELEDITGSLRIFSNRSENTNLLSAINIKSNNDKNMSQNDNNNLNIISNKNNGTNKNLVEQTSLKNDNLLSDSYKESNPNEPIFKDQKMKIDDLEQSKNKFLNEEKNVGKDNNFYQNLDINILKEEIKNIKSDKVIRLKNEEELNYILFELKKLSENQNKNQNINDSIYLILDNKDNNPNNNLKNSQIIKVKNNQITTFESNLLDNDANFKKKLNFNYNNNDVVNNLRVQNDFNNNFILKKNSNNLDILPNNNNNINNFKYIKDIKNSKEIIDNNNIQIQNHKTLEEKSDFSDNKVLNENNYERHTYVGNNNINIFKNNESPFNQFERHTNMIKGLQIKNMHTKNRSYGKDTHKKHKKKTGIIEQIKKEQSEKKNNGMFSTFNKRNRNIIIPNTGTPSSNIKKISKNSVAKIDYYNNLYKYDSSSIPNNINPGDNLNINMHHNKSKSVGINNINKCLSCSPKKQRDDFLKYKLNPQEKNEFYINKNNRNYILYNKDNNLNYDEEEFKKEYSNINYNINSKEENENNSLILLRQKYLEFLIKIYGNNNIPQNKENEEMDNIFLKGLVRNEVPIENMNLNMNSLKCSNDMKNFISESLENFKLEQLKEKLSKVNDYKTLNFNYNIEKNNDNKNSNLNGLIQLDYEDEIKDKSNILEPIELDKSNFNLNFRKSFIESLSGIRNDNIFYRSENISKK